MTDWRELSRRASLASHRLIGWIYWDPTAIANYTALGVPGGAGYYVATRCAPLAAAGDDAVVAACYSILPVFVRHSLATCREHTTFEAAAGARDAAVRPGLEAWAAEAIPDLEALADPLWAATDELTPSGRVLFGAHRSWPRPAADPLLSAWLAVNCLREWRGDTWWALQIADGMTPVAAGVLDGAWRAYTNHWVARSRGADDTALNAALEELGGRGLVTNGEVNAAGIAHRQGLEDRLDDLSAAPWQLLGEESTRAFLAAMEPVGGALLERVDITAGPEWMPAGRTRRA
jgi:hypothetical protein